VNTYRPVCPAPAGRPSSDGASRRWRRAGARLLAIAAVVGVAFGSAPPPGAQAAGRCGAHPWCDTTLPPDRRAELLLREMTQQEKVDLLAGDDQLGAAGGEHAHTGTQEGVPRLGVPRILYSDGPVGPRQGKSAGLPVPLALAATFDPAMAADHGRVAATEAKFKGNDVIFGPAVNIARNPLSGRTFENYGEDPFLQSRLVVPWITAAQKTGLIADVKHFAANNQEGADPTGGVLPLPLVNGLVGSRMQQNDVIDERTLREIYLPHFEAAVKEAKVGTLMCSYNRVRGQYACENEHLLQQILRKEWGFDGYVLSDYVAGKETAAALNTGMDFEPFPVQYLPPLVNAALATGRVSPATLDARIRAMLTTWFRFGVLDRPAFRDDDAQIDKQGDMDVAQRIEEGAITLLRNERSILPLRAGSTGSIAVIGTPATTFTTGGGSGNVEPFAFRSPLAAIRARAGAGTTVTYADGADHEAAVRAARGAGRAIVFVGDAYGEGGDRTCLSLQCPNVNGDQDELIRRVAAANPRTVVVLASGGPDLMPWRRDVDGIVQAWFGGSRSGPALARVLFGDIDPSGRLPITVPAAEKQTPTAVSPRRYPGVGLDVHYDEGVLIGYRWYDHQRLTPAYPFGFGLSYSTSTYRDLAVSGRTVSATVTNTGSRKGVVVPQLYVGLRQPDAATVQPPAQLKGFQKFELEPGASLRIRFELDDRALSFWDTRSKGWRLSPGCSAVMVGSSSRDLPLRGALNATDARDAACPATPTRSVARPRLRVTITPRKVRTGSRAVTIRVLVRARTGGRLVRVRRALVRIGSTRARTTAKGRASLRIRRTRPGVLRVRVTARGMRPASATLRVRRAG